MNHFHRITVACVLIVIQPAAACAAEEKLVFQTFKLNHTEPAKVELMMKDVLSEYARDIRTAIPKDTTQQLRVSAPPRLISIISEFIREADQPTFRSPPELAADRDNFQPRETFKSYQLSASQMRTSLDEIRRVIGRPGGIAVDRSRNIVMVRTTDDLHFHVAKILGSAPISTTSATRDTGVTHTDSATLPGTSLTSGDHPAMRLAGRGMAVSSAPYPNHNSLPEGQPAIPVATAEQMFPGSTLRRQRYGANHEVYQLRDLTVQQCQHALRKLLGSRFEIISHDEYRIQSGWRNLAVRFDSHDHTIRLEGDQRLAEQLRILLTGFEESQKGLLESTFRFVPLKRIRSEVLREAVDVWYLLGESRKPSSESGALRSYQFGSDGRIVPTEFRPRSEQSYGQVLPGQTNDFNQSQDRSVDSEDATAFPELGILMLRGEVSRVDEFVRVFEQIRQLAVGKNVSVDLVFLQHTRGESVRELVSEIHREFLHPSHGQIQVATFGRAEALLVVGWGEAFRAGKDLIGMLDRASGRQIRVIPVKHEVAASLSAAISKLLRRNGISPSHVSVSANARSNSLIVDAAHSYMEDAVRLIEQLDVAGVSNAPDSAVSVRTTLNPRHEAIQLGMRNGQPGWGPQQDNSSDRTLATGNWPTIGAAEQSSSRSPRAVTGPVHALSPVESIRRVNYPVASTTPGMRQVSHSVYTPVEPISSARLEVIRDRRLNTSKPNNDVTESEAIRPYNGNVKDLIEDSVDSPIQKKRSFFQRLFGK